MEVKTLQSRCRVGVARGDITPEVGTYHRMWGAASHDCSEGVHRPLTATALAFGSLDGNDDERQVVLAVDHCLLGFDEVENILNLVHEQSGVDRTRIVTTFSHTHAAGMLLRDRVDLPGGDLIPSYLDGLAETLGALTVKAIQSMVPANIVYGDGVCNLAGHRDLRDNELGENVCGFNPEGLADTNVVVARISDDQGDLMATVVNYACHPTTLAWDNRLISPDFPGAMRELVEGAKEGWMLPPPPVSYRLSRVLVWSPAMPMLLSAQSLSKSHGSRVLFEDVSLIVHDNDRLGVFGPNGTGKSSLMRILAGIDPPDEGSVETAKGAHIAYIPQEDSLPSGMTVEKVLIDALARTQ